jgi:hypothetical protein
MNCHSSVFSLFLIARGSGPAPGSQASNQSYMEKIIRIATGNFEFVREAMEHFNSVYKTDFSYVDSVVDYGVNFSLIDRGTASLNEIFLFGSFVGAKVSVLRARKEIDW